MMMMKKKSKTRLNHILMYTWENNFDNHLSFEQSCTRAFLFLWNWMKESQQEMNAMDAFSVAEWLNKMTWVYEDNFESNNTACLMSQKWLKLTRNLQKM